MNKEYLLLLLVYFKENLYDLKVSVAAKGFSS